MATTRHLLFLILSPVLFFGCTGWDVPVSSISDIHHSSSRPFQSSVFQTPLRFETNKGQTVPQVKFFSRGKGYQLFLTPDETLLSFSNPVTPIISHTGSTNETKPGTHAMLQLRLVGRNPAAQLVAEHQLHGQTHYFIGKDPLRWQTHVPTYSQVRYANIYPGIDLVYYGNQRQLEFDFIVAPGKDPSVITMEFGGVETMELETDGDLVLHTSSGIVRQRKPVIYQEIEGRKRHIQGEYRLRTSNQVGFQVDAYNANSPLIIDPVLVYSTYLGGSENDVVHDVTTDTEGNVYVMGLTRSMDFTVKNPLQPSNIAGDRADFFVTKFSPDGSTLIYSTYLGGSDHESGQVSFTPPMEGGGIAVNSRGEAYVAGTTASPDFPVRNALQDAKAGRLDAFVAKLAEDGSSLLYSTYLGGATHLEFGVTSQPAANRVNALAIDSAGNAYVTGVTDAMDFPTVNAFQSSYAGGIIAPNLEGDAFVTKVAPDGSSLVYSTYLGGQGADPHPFLGYDEGIGIAVDQSGSAFVTGITAAADFPTFNAFQSVKAGVTDIFLTKLTPDGSALTYSTFLGGSKNIVPEEFFMEYATGITLDASGDVYLAGWTYSNDFPIVNAFQPSADLSGENRTCFITKFTTDGSDLAYSTYLSGTQSDENAGPVVDRCKDIAVNTAGSAYVTGETSSGNFPVTADAFQSSGSGSLDAFMSKLTPNGSALAYSSYFGGASQDRGTSIELDPAGNAYVSGQTLSTDFPIKNAFQASHEGDADGFLMKFAPAAIDTIVDAGPSLTIIFPHEARLDGTVMEEKVLAPPGAPNTAFWSQVSGPGLVTFVDSTAIDTTASFSQPGTYVLRLAVNNAGFIISDTTTITVNPAFTVNQPPEVNAGPDQTLPLSSEAMLNGTVMDDGVPSGIITATWSMFSGPGAVNFGDSRAIATTAHFSQAGTYVLRLTAHDGTLQAFDEVAITVTPVEAHSTPFDFNGDTTADLLWRDRNSGLLAMWLMDGTTISESESSGRVPAQWTVEGIGDVDGDGKADIIWKSSTNVVAIWLMNELAVSSVSFPGGVSSEWAIEGVGDVNGDGNADVIWRNEQSGQMAVWLMNGGRIAFSGFFTGVPLGWDVAGMGDVDGDGKADLVGRNNTSGSFAVWFMDSLTIRSVGFLGVTLALPQVTIKGVGDLNGDSKADIIWQNEETHEVFVWLMNSDPLFSHATIGAVPPAWKMEQVADANGDGKADIFWHNTHTGDVAIWLMNGATIESAGFPGGVSPNWQIQP